MTPRQEYLSKEIRELTFARRGLLILALIFWIIAAYMADFELLFFLAGLIKLFVVFSLITWYILLEECRSYQAELENKRYKPFISIKF